MKLQNEILDSLFKEMDNVKKLKKNAKSPSTIESLKNLIIRVDKLQDNRSTVIGALNIACKHAEQPTTMCTEDINNITSGVQKFQIRSRRDSRNRMQDTLGKSRNLTKSWLTSSSSPKLSNRLTKS